MKTAILAIPRLEPHRPPPGPAIVANLCASMGHQVVMYDLNIKLFNFCKKHNVDYHGLDTIFDKVSDPTQTQLEFLNSFMYYWADQLVHKDYDYVMLGVFGMSAQWFAEHFLKILRPKIQSKIVIGGMGVGVTGLLHKNTCFGESMKSQNLIDDYIVGEAERSLISYLNGVPGPGINNTEISQIEDIENLPVPDYSYFDLTEYDYLHNNQKEVYITGSRGCVRKCSYCDVEKFWPKYRYRSGNSIATEIIENYEKFGITRFYFTDSLINGSLKVFADMCDILSNYNFPTKISWSGQFIFRNQKALPKNHFETMAKAGADILYVGVETGSDRLRREIGKNFSNDDIDFQLEQCSRYKVKVIPLMFTGYVTETLQDHIENLEIFRRWQKYVADGTIPGIELGSGLAVLQGAPIERMLDQYGMSFLLDQNQMPVNTVWQSQINPDLDIREQIRRRIEVHETAIKYKWPVWRQHSRLKEFQRWILQNQLHKSPKDFYRIIDNNKNTSQPKKIIPLRTA
jgi:hypothetical protein